MGNFDGKGIPLVGGGRIKYKDGKPVSYPSGHYAIDIKKLQEEDDAYLRNKKNII